MGFVWSGYFGLLTAAPSGDLVLLADFEPGEFFGYTTALLALNHSASQRVVSDQGGVLLLAPAPEILALAQASLEFSQAVNRDLAQQTTRYAARVYEMAAFDVRARLLAELLRLARHAQRRQNSCTIRPSPTHAALATRISATREVVTRELRVMAAEGLLALERGSIEIHDVNRLSKILDGVAGDYYAGLTRNNVSQDLK